MRNFLLLLVVALIVAGGYEYNKNPKACQKLGLDIANDTTAIFTPTDGTSSGQNGTSDSGPVSMENNLLQNGDFSSTPTQWKGDGGFDSRVGKGLIVPLSSNSWTKVEQDFKGDKGTRDTIIVRYKVSSDISVSNRAEDFNDVANQVRFEGYEGYGPVNLPPGDILLWIGDLANHSSRYEMYPLKPDSGDTKTIEHTYPAGAAFADKVVVLAFPPGTGNVEILGVSVTSSD